MNRTVSPPVHLHLGKKNPVHVHINPPGGHPKKRLSRREKQELSCNALTSGKPGPRNTSSQSRSSRSSYWVSPSSSKNRSTSPWIPPPGNATKPQMSWEGPTHRLEINPNPSGSMMLHVSDLSGEDCSTDVLVEDEPNHYTTTMDDLRAKVDQLKAEVDLQKSLRDLDEKESALRMSQESLRRKTIEVRSLSNELIQSEKENASLQKSLPSSPIRPKASLDSEEKYQRERLIVQLAQVDTEGFVVMKKALKFKASIKKLQKDRRFVSIHAAQLTENKDSFLASLEKFDQSNKLLSKLVRSQQLHSTSVGHLTEHRDLLGQKLMESECNNHLLREKLEEQHELAMHSQSLHDEIGEKEGRIQSMGVRLRSMEEQLNDCELVNASLRKELSEAKANFQRDKELLKRATKQHKYRATRNESTLESVSSTLDETNAEISHMKAKLTKSAQIALSHQMEVSTLNGKVRDLEDALAQNRVTCKVSLDAVSAQLAEKTHDLNSSQMEVDRLRALLSSLETRLHTNENADQTKISGLEMEVLQLKGSVKHYDGIVTEYKAQLDRSRAENEELSKELRTKDQEMDQIKQESIIETEKCRLKLHQEMADLVPMPELLKNSELRLSDVQERLMEQDQRSGEQTRMIAELTVRAEQGAATIDSLKEKLHEAVAERRAMETRLASSDRRQSEVEQQNRELMGISGRKEDMVQRLQKRIEEQTQEVATMSAQLEAGKADSRRHAEQVKERATAKERSNLARIADLESQLSRSNNLATQFRKSKEDLDRRYHSRVHELQEKLEQANSTKRSLDNYITFLKSSYANVFSDSHVPGSPIPPMTR